MKGQEAQTSSTDAKARPNSALIKPAHRAQYIPARDSRNRRIPGLYLRNGRFYAQLWVDRGNGMKTARRFPLVDENEEPITTLAAAKEAMEIKRNERRENALPAPGLRPTLNEYAKTYLEKPSVLVKRPGTVQNESQALSRWKAHMGGVRLDKIVLPYLAAFVDRRLKSGVSKRTVVLDLIALRNLFKAAVEDGLLEEAPKFPKVRPEPAKKRSLLEPDEFKALLAACTAIKPDNKPITKNGDQLRDYLQFLAYSGSREQEALRVRWSDVDLKGKRVTIGSDGMSKNHMSRTVEFNPQLQELLTDMKSRRAPNCHWLFPSPQRGEKDIHARSFRESLKLVRDHAKLPWVGFHDLRHMFASICVMAGVDFMTIAGWMGHKDGGILVGKVYGHLLDEHRHSMASKLNFNSKSAA